MIDELFAAAAAALVCGIICGIIIMARDPAIWGAW